MTAAWLTGIGNHLWQSTLLAGIAGLLTLALRENGARVRHAVWLAASYKFLIPFSALVALGRRIEWRTVPEVGWLGLSAAVTQAGQPFMASGSASHSVARAASVELPVGAFLLAIWLCGFVGIGVAWWVRWRRIRTIARAGALLPLDISIEARSSDTLLEPSVFGIVRPVLLLPEGLIDRLTPEQLRMIVAHELCHVRHRDNLTASIHMLVETVFWFHPLVWWIGKRMVEERERACDEEVLRLGGEPRDYADGILSVCRLYLESPLECVSGVTGSNLKKRIEAIVLNRVQVKLGLREKAVLATAVLTVLATPLMIGVFNAPAVRAQAAQNTKFDEASVVLNSQLHDPGNAVQLGLGGAGARGSHNGQFNVHNVDLNLLIQLAYGVEYFQVLGAPPWANSDSYSISAKTRSNADFEQMRPMLQSLLADRFKLALHRETHELPIYELAAAHGGLKIQAANAGSCVEFNRDGPPPPVGTKGCGGLRYQLLPLEETIEGFGITMPRLAKTFSGRLGRTVIDKTGYIGMFNLLVKMPVEKAGDLASPQIQAAFEEQLGLRLQSGQAPVELLVIDHAEKPAKDF